MKGDTPIELTDLTKMSNEDLDALITNIRERRLAPIKAYNDALLLKEQARVAGLEKQLDKALEMFDKERDRADKAIEKLEARALKIRALRLEIDG